MIRLGAGRPKKFDINDIIEKLEQYIADNEEPMILEFCVNYGINRSYLYELSEKEANNNNDYRLTDTIKRAIQKEECFLVKNAERQKINPVFAMFRLKQPAFGYKDKQEVESTNVNINKDVDINMFKEKATPEELLRADELTPKEIQEILKR